MKKILVLTDFSKKSEHAAEFALAIAAKVNAEVTLHNAFYVPSLVPVDPAMYSYYDDYAESGKENMDELNQLAERLKKKYVKLNGSNPPPITLKNCLGLLKETIEETAGKNKFWLIVMGDQCKEGAISRFMFGSNTYSVIDRVSCPVLLVPEKAVQKPFRKIVFAASLRQAEHKAVSFLKKFGDFYESEISVIHVTEEKPSVEEKVKNYDAYSRLNSGVDYPNIYYRDIAGKDIVKTISSLAGKEGPDLLVVQHKQRSVIGKLFHTSITKELMEFHRVPLLVVPSKS